VLVIANMLYQIGMLQRSLEALGWEPTIAHQEQIGVANLEAVSYDLVILDVDLGYGSLRNLALRMREAYPGTRLGILLGWWDQREPELRNLCDMVIYKPVHPGQLAEALARPVDEGPRDSRLPGRSFDEPAILGV